ncbi:hypothetical protein TNCV_2556791 [Trichonephila clavipes]|nr:hypothetical protein TNCV_2556791 [Trichonephila clavipes]
MYAAQQKKLLSTPDLGGIPSFTQLTPSFLPRGSVCMPHVDDSNPVVVVTDATRSAKARSRPTKFIMAKG